jgi:FkbM family methyltransferase
MSERVLNKYIQKYNVQFKGVVHLGACNAEEQPVYMNNGATFIVWAEANPEKWTLLKAGACKIPHNYLYCGAITDKDNDYISFKIYNHTEASSLYNPGNDLNRWYPDHKVLREFRIPTITVDTMLKNFDININEINWLTMDIQGAEHLAIKGADNLLSNPNLKFIYTEVVWADFYEKGSATKEGVTSLLNRYGFELKEIENDVHKAYLPHVQALIDAGMYEPVAQADVLYVR